MRRKMATLREMENVALSMEGLSNDLGNVIDITDNSDALGLNMLANQAKISFGSNNTNTVNVQSSAPILG